VRTGWYLGLIPDRGCGRGLGNETDHSGGGHENGRNASHRVFSSGLRGRGVLKERWATKETDAASPARPAEGFLGRLVSPVEGGQRKLSWGGGGRTCKPRERSCEPQTMKEEGRQRRSLQEN